MSENGESKKSVTGEVLSLIEDQMDLASLEWQYEKSQSLRRLVALGVAVLLAITSFAVLQIAMIAGLLSVGVSAVRACLILAVIYAIVTGLLVWRYGRRDPRAEKPFQASREELHKNLKWIRQIFS